MSIVDTVNGVTTVLSGVQVQFVPANSFEGDAYITYYVTDVDGVESTQHVIAVRVFQLAVLSIGSSVARNLGEPRRWFLQRSREVDRKRSCQIEFLQC